MNYDEIADELLDVYGEACRRQFNQQINRYAKGEMFALNYLCEHDGSAYPKDIGKGMQVSFPRVTVLLNHLESKGWISRTDDVNDNRQTIVTLTGEGQEALAKSKDELKNVLVDALKRIGKEDAETYLRIRKKILNI